MQKVTVARSLVSIKIKIAEDATVEDVVWACYDAAMGLGYSSHRFLLEMEKVSKEMQNANKT
jgi:hypothetical protein